MCWPPLATVILWNNIFNISVQLFKWIDKVRLRSLKSFSSCQPSQREKGREMQPFFKRHCMRCSENNKGNHIDTDLNQRLQNARHILGISSVACVWDVASLKSGWITNTSCCGCRLSSSGLDSEMLSRLQAPPPSHYFSLVTISLNIRRGWY